MYAVSSRRPWKHSLTRSLWTPRKYSGGVMLWYTSTIRAGSAKAVREARDPIEK